MPVRAGRGLRYRIHSLEFSEEKSSFGAGERGSDGLPRFTVEVAHRPHIELKRIETPRFFVRGASSFGFRAVDEPFHGCYLTIIAAKPFDVRNDLVAAFAKDAHDERALSEIVRLVHDDIVGELRQDAILAATICAVKLAPAIIEPWLEFDIYWSTPQYHITRYASAVSEVLDGQSATNKEVLALAENVLLGSTDSQYRKAFQLAGGWYLRGRAEAAGTTERFLGLFQCLEALTNCAPQGPDPELLKWLEIVSELFVSRSTEEQVSLRATLAIIKQRLTRPTLNERFTRLLDILSLPQKDELVKQFDALNKLRNDLLHAHITFVPGYFRGFNVDPTITALSATVLAAVADRIITGAKDRGYSVSFVDPSSRAV